MNRLLVKMEIDKRTDDIIKELDTFTGTKGISGAFGRDNNTSSDRKIGRSQLASLLSDCKNAASVDEMKLYINYKKAKGNGWNDRVNGRAVADYLIDALNNVEKLADNIREALKLKNEDVNSDDMRQIRLMLCEKFFGYLYWKGTALSSEEASRNVR